MSKTKAKKPKPLSPKKETRLQVIEQLQAALPGLKDILGEKEFQSRAKKAAKLLVAGLKPVSPKKPKVKKASQNQTTENVA